MTAGRWAAVVVCSLVALPFLLGLANVAIGAFSTDPATDPHGYSVVFGFLFCALFGPPLFALLPLVAPPERRRAWSRASLAALVVLVGGAFLLLLVGS